MGYPSMGAVGSVDDQAAGDDRKAAADGPITTSGCCTMEAMNVEVLVVPECPHQASAVELAVTALADIGLSRVEPRVTMIATQDEAEARQFIGSPTFAMNGRDVFEVRDHPASLSCRLYQGADGLPDLRALRQAFKRAAAQVVGW